eukprot:COSAG02_NODE_5302_length_4458_cov_32.131682_1_plen_948_part_10
MGALPVLALAVPAALAQQTCAEECQPRAQQCETVCTQARAQLELDNMYEEILDTTLTPAAGTTSWRPGAEAYDFGQSVAVSGSVAVVGAPGSNKLVSAGGSAWIFERQLDGSWAGPTQLVKASGHMDSDYFGSSVAVSGSVAIVGVGVPYVSRQSSSPLCAAYVFDRQLGWAQVAKLVPPGYRENWCTFGMSSVAVSGSVAVVGDRDGHREGYASIEMGTAYVFERQLNGSWVQVATLVAADGADGDEFGKSVAVCEGVAVVGAPHNDDARNAPASGAAYVFDRQPDGSWVQVAKLVAPDTAANAEFGNSVAVSGRVVVVGAWQGHDASSIDGTDLAGCIQDPPSCNYVDGRFLDWHDMNPGAAYVFERHLDGSWVQAKLVPPDAAVGQLYRAAVPPWVSRGDQFGTSVAVSGSVVVIGAPYHDGGGDVNPDTGAAYEFERQPDGSWAQVAKLGVADANIVFLGLSVAVSGDVAVIGTDSRTDWDTTRVAYLYVKDCATFRDVPNVVDNSCTRCTGREPHECLAASCAPGYVSYQQGGFCCNDLEIEDTAATGSCTQCTGSAADECTDATCATGFGAFSNGTCCRAHLIRYAGACRCPAGRVENQLETACEACPAGTQSNSDRTLCEVCPSGRARSTQETCVSCEVGTAANPGQTACEICAAGKQPSASHDDCELCNGTTFSTDGQCQDCPHPNIVDDSHQTCLPCPAGKSPSSNYSSCVRCTGATYSQFGINCLPCDAASIVDGERTSCTKCDPGTEPIQNSTRCEQCPPGTVRSTQEQCSQCDAGKAQNSDQTACESCAAGKRSFDGIVCTCDVGWYQYRGDRVDHFAEPIVCQEATFKSPQQTPQPGCNRCGRCVKCNNTATVASGYIRIFGPDASISVHKCMFKQGCHGEPVINTSIAGCKSCKEKTLPLSAGCRPLFTGHFCSTCIDGYEFQGGEGVLEAQDC